MNAAIIELDALADAVRAATENNHFLSIARLCLAFGLSRLAVGADLSGLVAGIHIRGARFEFGGAGVDALIDRMDAQRGAQRPDGGFVLTGQLAQARIAESGALQRRKSGTLLRQAGNEERLFDGHQFFDLFEKPWIEMAGLMNFIQFEPGAEGFRHHQQPVGTRQAEGGEQNLAVAAGAPPIDLNRTEAGDAGFHRSQRLLQRFLEAAADRHRLADGFHRSGQKRARAGEFFEREARHLGYNIIDRRLEGRRRDAGDVVVDFIQGVAHG